MFSYWHWPFLDFCYAMRSLKIRSKPLDLYDRMMPRLHENLCLELVVV